MGSMRVMDPVGGRRRSKFDDALDDAAPIFVWLSLIIKAMGTGLFISVPRQRLGV
jgi:hypothetical protein